MTREKYFPENLKAIRENWNKTQLEMAVYTGYEKQTYANYELGKREAPIELMLLMEEKTGIALRRLVFEKIPKIELREYPLGYENSTKILQINEDKVEYESAWQKIERLEKLILELLKRVEALENEKDKI